MSAAKHTYGVLEQRGENIRLIRATEDGKPCWFYIRLHPHKVLEYEEKMKTGDLDVSGYGQILESDWGTYPPADVIGFMMDEYDFNTPTEESLPK